MIDNLSVTESGSCATVRLMSSHGGSQIVGQRLQTAREAKKLSPEQLARKIGTTRMSVRNWESGVHNVLLYFPYPPKTHSVNL